jgi:hypothetical protein
MMTSSQAHEGSCSLASGDLKLVRNADPNTFADEAETSMTPIATRQGLHRLSGSGVSVMRRCRRSMKGDFMRTASQELTLRSTLSDPLIRLVMEADGADPRALDAMPMAIASRIRRRRQPQGVGTSGSTPVCAEN